MESLTDKITTWLAPKLEELDCFLVDVKVLNVGKKIEVYIDKDEGIVISTCEKVSRYLEFYLDNDGSVTNQYTLDVSSPGMENPFKVQRQYQKNIGREVEVVFHNGIKKDGILKEADTERISIEIHEAPKKKGMKPAISTETIQFSEIKSVKKKITFK